MQLIRDFFIKLTSSISCGLGPVKFVVGHAVCVYIAVSSAGLIYAGE